jgi:hypothetical protein
MDGMLQPVFHLYESSDRLIPEIVSHLGEEDLSYRPNGDWNSILRLYGHVTVLRQRLHRVLAGSSDPVKFEESCGGYPDAADEVPVLTEIDAAYRAATSQLYATFEELGPDRLLGEGRGRGFFPTSDETLLGTITFVGYHEAYTVGQMGYVGHLRRKLPKTGLLG